MSEKRVQERQRCGLIVEGIPWCERFDPECDGCNNDGTRWVTVGTLQEVPGIGSRRADGTVKYVYGECEMDWAWIDNLPDWAVELFAIQPLPSDPPRSEVA